MPTSGVNFNSIDGIPFFYKNILCSHPVLTVYVCNFLVKVNYSKADHKMLVKLTTGENRSIGNQGRKESWII